MLSPDAEAALDRNRALWDGWTRSRVSAAFDDLAVFRSGASTLSQAELAAIGDVKGLRLLHLQCNFGLDTLSLARAGAMVTGADFSGPAIKLARELAAECDLEAHFVHSDLYRLPTVLKQRFDMVYSSRGVLSWLPDILSWAHVVAHMLEPGGRFHLFDAHPTAQMFDEEREISDPRVRYPYFGDPSGTYVPLAASGAVEANGDEANGDEVEHAHQWAHTLGDVVSALADSGLSIDNLTEHEFSFWQAFPGLYPDPEDPRLWRPAVGEGFIPLTFSLNATRL